MRLNYWTIQAGRYRPGPQILQADVTISMMWILLRPNVPVAILTTDTLVYTRKVLVQKIYITYSCTLRLRPGAPER